MVYLMSGQAKMSANDNKIKFKKQVKSHMPANPVQLCKAKLQASVVNYVSCDRER
jgi:hypothetical protein